MNLKRFFIVGLSCVCFFPVCGCKADSENSFSSEIRKDEMVTLNLEGTKNTRDLGEYKNSNGKVLKDHLYFRSDNTNNLTDADIQKLKEEHNLKCVIDLRYDSEIASAPDKLSNAPGIKYCNVPLVISKEQMKNLINGNVDLGDLYIEFLTQKDMVKTIFDIIAEVEDGSILFHCVNGKDRTGIVAALLLGLNGVTKEDIVNNYSATYELIKDNEAVKKGIEKYGTDVIFKSEPEYMSKLVDYVINHYGSFENYLLSCGISQENLDKVKDRFQK